MKLLHADRVLVPRGKVMNYLLAPNHPSGKSKAAFFERFGFTNEEWEVLARALKQHALAFEVDRTEASPFGTRYVIEGELSTPSGRTPLVRTVWFLDRGSETPRFVTAYPIR